MPTMQDYYRALLSHFGPQHWWPAESPFEVMVGAVLAQNTTWGNVQKAIRNLKMFRLLDPHKILELDEETLQEAVRPAGYFRQKAARLKRVAAWLVDRFDGSTEKAAKADGAALREELLAIKGIGPETADSILLYAFGKPFFVIDTYTWRVLSRHRMVGEETSYEEMQELMHSKLPRDSTLYNEFHALLVAVGKEFCRKEARCERCPLKPFLPE